MVDMLLLHREPSASNVELMFVVRLPPARTTAVRSRCSPAANGPSRARAGGRGASGRDRQPATDGRSLAMTS
jgi:hypothetical protein